MFLQNFIDEQNRLLTLERSEEINQSKIISESPPKILEEKNLCIRKLKIANIFTGLYSRTIIELEFKEGRKDSSKRVFSHGDMLAVCKDSGKNDVTKPIATGLFYNITKDYIQVALDNDLEENINIREAEGTMLRLVKLSSEVTYQRLKAGLKYLEKRSNPLCGDHLIDLLMGDGYLCSPAPVKDITYFNEKLNQSQKDAVKFAISRPDIAIVHGPPGTGKTTVAVEIISQILDKPNGSKCPKILVCTPSNIALDNLAEKLLKVSLLGKNEKAKSGKNIKVLRLGHSARIMSHLSDISIDHKLSICDQAELICQVRSQIDWTLKQSLNRNGKRLDKRGELNNLRKELRERELKAVREVLSSSQVIMSTLTGLRSNKSLPLNEIDFDVVIIDEVSQAIEAACWLAIPRGKKLILAGDHKQLPPTVLSEEAMKAGLGRSLMERLLELFPPAETTRMLSCQYRMHENIMQWSSDTFYNSELVADTSVAKHCLSDICTDNDCDSGPLDPLVFIDTAGTDLWELESTQEDSKANLGEAHLAAVYIKYLVDRFSVCPDQIGVITPYSRQVQLIKQCLREKVEFGPEFQVSEIEVSTVDGFQGREKEVIVTTLVRSNPSGVVGFLSETRRLNVALTRAKRHLCVIGDSSTIEKSGHKTLISLVEYWNTVADIHSAHEYIYENDINSGDCVRPKPTPKSKTETVKQERLDTKDLEKRFGKQIRKFKANDSETTLEFSADLVPRTRAFLHDLSEQLGLNHVSVGEGTSRKLIVSKPLQETKLKTIAEEKDPEQSKAIVSIPPPQEIKLPIEVVEKKIEAVKKMSPSIISENTLKKVVTSQPLKLESKEKEEMSLPLCVKKKETIPTSLVIDEKSCAQITNEKVVSAKPIKIKKTKPIKKESMVDELSDDFDTVIKHFEEMNKICQNPTKCTTPVAVLGFDCRFCKRRFCSNHAQQEVHNCSRVDMSVWRAESRDKRPVSKKQEIRHSQLSRAMAKKIDGMTAERSGGSGTKKK